MTPSTSNLLWQQKVAPKTLPIPSIPRHYPCAKELLLLDVVAIAGFNLNRLNPKEFAAFSFVSCKAIALDRSRTPLTALITHTR